MAQLLFRDDAYLKADAMIACHAAVPMLTAQDADVVVSIEAVLALAARRSG